MRILACFLFLAVFGGASIVAAEPTPSLWPVTPICINKAAAFYAIPEAYMYATLALEGGSVGHIAKHSNGNSDIGPWQISTYWLLKWSAELKDNGFSQEILRDNGCANAWVAAWRIAAETTRHGDWDGLGRYHSGTFDLKRKYQQKLRKILVATGYGDYRLRTSFSPVDAINLANKNIERTN